MALWTPANLSTQPLVWVRGRNATFDGSDNVTAVSQAGTLGGSFGVSATPPTKGTTLNGQNTIRFDAGPEYLTFVSGWSASELYAFAFVKFLDNVTAMGGVYGSAGYNDQSNVSGMRIAIANNGGINGTAHGFGVFFGESGAYVSAASSSAANIADRTDWASYELRLGPTASQTWGNTNLADFYSRVDVFNCDTLSSQTWQVGNINDDGANPLNGDLAELMIFPGMPSGADQARLQGWAFWDAGRADLLPSGHTYKSAAPTVAGGAPPIASPARPFIHLLTR